MQHAPRHRTTAGQGRCRTFALGHGGLRAGGEDTNPQGEAKGDGAELQEAIITSHGARPHCVRLHQWKSGPARVLLERSAMLPSCVNQTSGSTGIRSAKEFGGSGRGAGGDCGCGVSTG